MKEFFIIFRPGSAFPHIAETEVKDGNLCPFLWEKIECDCFTTVNFDDCIMIVDDDGLLKGREVNPVPTLLYNQKGIANSFQPIVGPAVIGLRGERDGEPDIVGFDSMLSAFQFATKILQRCDKDMQLKEGDSNE